MGASGVTRARRELKGDKGDPGVKGDSRRHRSAGNSGRAGPARSGRCRQAWRRRRQPPANYAGLFRLQFDDSGNTIALATAAGCFDKLAQAEFEDCYLSTKILSPDLIAWLHDSVNGSNAFRDLTLIQVSDISFNEVSRTSIDHAFLRDFSISDLDGSSNTVGVLSFVLVPRNLQSAASSGVSLVPNTPRFLNANFVVNIDSVDGSRINAVRNLHMSAPKILVSPQLGTHHQFLPGQPSFDNLTIEMSVAGTTASSFDAWAHNIALGQNDLRVGTVNLMNTTFSSSLAEIDLFDLSPLSFPAFQTSDGHRTVVLSISRFLMQ